MTNIIKTNMREAFEEALRTERPTSEIAMGLARDIHRNHSGVIRKKKWWHRSRRS